MSRVKSTSVGEVTLPKPTVSESDRESPPTQSLRGSSSVIGRLARLREAGGVAGGVAPEALGWETGDEAMVLEVGGETGDASGAMGELGVGEVSGVPAGVVGGACSVGVAGDVGVAAGAAGWVGAVGVDSAGFGPVGDGAIEVGTLEAGAAAEG